MAFGGARGAPRRTAIVRRAAPTMPAVNPGLLYGALAFVGWGLYPLFFRELAAVAPLEIILHRALWSVPAVALLLALLGRWSWLGPLLRSPRQLRMVLLGALLIGANWLIYVWAVSEHRVVEASLGYFINPIANVALGVVVLGERLRPVQWAAVALAATGVLWLTVTAGTLPWIALALALLFALYGLVRKTAVLGALEGLAAETALMALIALPLLAWWTFTQPGAALAQVQAGGHAGLLAWLVLTGPVTVLPLLGFAAAARRLSLAALGLLQYISPTLQFALGLWVFGEPMDAARLAGFALIWSALVLYSADAAGWIGARRPR